MVPKKSPSDVLRSSKVVRAEQVLRDDSGDVPPIVRDAYQILKSEIVQLRLSRESERAKPKQVADDSSVHPAVTGLSVGSAKEVVDWCGALLVEGDPYGTQLLSMTFVDGGITAVLATVAAWISKSNRR